jgi:hypothetical protein
LNVHLKHRDFWGESNDSAQEGPRKLIETCKRIFTLAQNCTRKTTVSWVVYATEKPVNQGVRFFVAQPGFHGMPIAYVLGTARTAAIRR